MALLTARSPSRTASWIWLMMCLCAPLMSTVHEKGFLTPSTNVYVSSSSVCSSTLSA